MDDELKKLEEQKTLVHSEIEKYGRDLETIKAEIADAEGKKSDIESLTKEVEDLTIKKNDLAFSEKEFSTLESKKKSILDDIESCKKVIAGMAEKIKAAKDLEDKITNLTTIASTLEIKITKLESDIATKGVSISDITSKLSHLEKSHEEKSKGLDLDFSAKVANSKIEIQKLDSEIEEKTKKSSELDGEISKKELELNGVYEKISIMQGDYNNLEKTYNDKKAAKEVDIVNLGKDIETRNAAVDQREGDLSIKEGAFEQKKTALLGAKTRLEKELGKSININI